jgi:hypothetical protein
MNWQDLIFTIGQFIFVIALIPTIRGKDKPAFITSLITTIILFSFAATYLTLKLWGSAIFASLNATAWVILAIQKYIIDTKSKK